MKKLSICVVLLIAFFTQQAFASKEDLQKKNNVRAVVKKNMKHNAQWTAKQARRRQEKEAALVESRLSDYQKYLAKKFFPHIVAVHAAQLLVAEYVGKSEFEEYVSSNPCYSIYTLRRNKPDMLINSIDVNTPDPQGDTLLHKVVSEDSTILANFLKLLTPNVNAQNERGRTALFGKFPEETTEVALLIGAGADLTIKDAYGCDYEQSSRYRTNRSGDNKRDEALDALANSKRIAAPPKTEASCTVRELFPPQSTNKDEPKK